MSWINAALDVQGRDTPLRYTTGAERHTALRAQRHTILIGIKHGGKIRSAKVVENR
jgi:hypothetical protein